MIWSRRRPFSFLSSLNNSFSFRRSLNCWFILLFKSDTLASCACCVTEGWIDPGYLEALSGLRFPEDNTSRLSARLFPLGVPFPISFVGDYPARLDEFNFVQVCLSPEVGIFYSRWREGSVSCFSRSCSLYQIIFPNSERVSFICFDSCPSMRDFYFILSEQVSKLTPNLCRVSRRSLSSYELCSIGSFIEELSDYDLASAVGMVPREEDLCPRVIDVFQQLCNRRSNELILLAVRDLPDSYYLDFSKACYL